jgi:plastocyanin domain-containing protein
VTTMHWLAIAGGLAAIAWVNWYFFLAERRSALATVSAGAAVQQQTIVVKGGYVPALVRVKAGIPVRLVFDRQETSGCSEEVVFPDFGVRRFLPAFRQTTIELPAPGAGRYDFMCGMSMLRGTLVAER